MLVFKSLGQCKDADLDMCKFVTFLGKIQDHTVSMKAVI